MSIEKRFHIYCDKAKCDNMEIFLEDFKGVVQVLATDMGWSSYGRKTYCPRCNQKSELRKILYSGKEGVS